jgi:excisionase family DNA binding protein
MSTKDSPPIEPHDTSSRRSATPQRTAESVSLLRLLVASPPEAKFSIPEAAVYLNRTQKWVRKAVASEEFPSRRYGRGVLILKSDLDAYDERSERKAAEGVA